MNHNVANYKSSSNKNKQLYLMSDEGFMRTYVISLITIGIVGQYLWSNIPFVRVTSIDVYYRVNEWMTTLAHRHAWWSLIGLLSSSCCALQLLLNTVSFGCAGFNTLLGPIRPVMLSITTLLQMVSWYVARDRPYQYVPTSITTMIVIGFTFLPEFLFWYNARNNETSTINNIKTRKGRRKSSSEQRLQSSEEKEVQHNDRINLIVVDDNNNNKGKELSTQHETTTTTTLLQYRLENVGCSACITTISNILKRIHIVEDFSISLENGGTLSVTTINKNNYHNNNSDTHTTNIDGTKNNDETIISVKLEEAGFPVQLLTIQ